MPKYLFFILFISSFNLANAQNHQGFKWMGPDRKQYEVNPVTQEFLINSLVGEKQKVGVLTPAGVFSELPKDFDVCVFYKGDTITVSVPGTGQVYKLDPKALVVERLDRTFFRGYNFTASQFLHNDTLFSIGGEGFWLRHNVITYYNTRTHEWTLYTSGGKNEQPSSAYFSGYSAKHNQFFSAYLYPGTEPYDKEIFAYFFDFNTRTWLKKGPVNSELLSFSKQLFRSVWTGTHLICFYGSDQLFIVDPFNNKLSKYAKHTDKFFLDNAQIYYQSGKLYSLQYNNTKTGDAYSLDSLAVEKLVKEAELVGPLYLSTFDKYQKYIVGLLIFCLLFGLVLVFRNKQKSKNKLFSDQEEQLLNVFTKLAIGQHISSSELNAILQIKNKSYDNQRQIRNRIIGSLNTKVQPFVKGQELILRVGNEEDKRMMNYYLNPEIKPKELEKLMQMPL
jgi:hypothetical protein